MRIRHRTGTNPSATPLQIQVPTRQAEEIPFSPAARLPPPPLWRRRRKDSLWRSPNTELCHRRVTYVWSVRCEATKGGKRSKYASLDPEINQQQKDLGIFGSISYFWNDATQFVHRFYRIGIINHSHHQRFLGSVSFRSAFFYPILGRLITMYFLYFR